MSELVKVDETTLKAKLTETDQKVVTIEQKVDALVSAIKPMPDDIKQKLKDVLTWFLANL